MSSGRGGWSLAIATTAVMLGIAELALRQVAPDRLLIWPPDLHRELTPVGEIMPGVEGVSTFTISTAGLRGRDPGDEDSYRIIAIGGSTTECLYLDDAEAWPAIVERRITQALGGRKVWIGNGGRSGHNSRNHRLQAAAMIEQDPRIDVLVMLLGVNDFALRLRRDESFVPLQEESPGYRRRLFYRSFAVIPPGAEELGFPQATAIWQRVRLIRKTRRQTGATDVEDKTGRVYVERRQRRQNADIVIDRLPDLATGLADYDANVRAIVQHATERGVRVLLVTQPALWREDLERDLESLLWFGNVSDPEGSPSRYYSVETLSQGMHVYNQALLKICADSAAVCLDAASLMPRDLDTFYDDVHFNESGSRRIAGLVSAALLEILRQAGEAPDSASKNLTAVNAIVAVSNPSTGYDRNVE